MTTMNTPESDIITLGTVFIFSKSEH